MASKYLLGLLSILILISGFSFYWYEYRPKKIKETCSAEAHLDKRAVFEPDDLKRQDFIYSYYNDCLTRFGLK